MTRERLLAGGDGKAGSVALNSVIVTSVPGGAAFAGMVTVAPTPSAGLVDTVVGLPATTVPLFVSRGVTKVTILSVLVEAALGLPARSLALPAPIEAITAPLPVMPLTATL